MNTQLMANGSGVWQIELGLDASDMEIMSQMEMSPEEFCEQTASEELGLVHS